ncbi:hypothetical protein [Methylobacterium sp. WSM2598]|uniref:hypothetical protein n=1 Tax=Methylobacterium sp. WSM2598 TaxID=398261 RepID=UPI00039E1C85|nr:hypothetical protein [Methylobacterium sp. WSM2598]
MAETVFGDGEIAAWGDALEGKRPREIEEIEWFGFPQVESFTAALTNVAMAFRFVDRDGKVIDCLMNPVVARAVAVTILNGGIEAGWLDAKGTVIAPLRPKEH